METADAEGNRSGTWPRSSTSVGGFEQGKWTTALRSSPAQGLNPGPMTQPQTERPGWIDQRTMAGLPDIVPAKILRKPRLARGFFILAGMINLSADPGTQVSMRKLPMSSKLAFGTGQVAEGIKTTVFNTFALFYYNQIIGISATLTALALGIAVLIDALTDPAAGYLSDRTRSKWGRRHPWILSAAIPMSICLYMLFNPPADMSEGFYFGWLIVTSVLLRLFLTLYYIPHMALGAEMAHDYIDRSRVFSYSTMFGWVGAWGYWFFAMSFFFATAEDGTHGMYRPEQYQPFSLLAAVLAASAIGICCWGTWKEIPHLRVVTSAAAISMKNFGTQIISVLTNASYLRIIVGLTLGTLVLAIEGVFNAYMGIHFWGLATEDLRWLALAVALGLPIAFVGTPIITRLLDKKMTLVSAAVLGIVSANVFIILRLLDLLPENGHPFIIWCVLIPGFVTGVIGPIILITVNSMFADIADEQELETGERQEGIIYSARAFVLKATGALGGVFGGIGIDLIAFPEKAEPGTVAPDVIFNLGLIAGPVTSIFSFAGLILYLGYKLDYARVMEIKAALDARNAGKE